jgi:hypothetical protein
VVFFEFFRIVTADKFNPLLPSFNFFVRITAQFLKCVIDERNGRILIDNDGRDGRMIKKSMVVFSGEDALLSTFFPVFFAAMSRQVMKRTRKSPTTPP